MPRLSRDHVPQGLYYIVHRCPPGRTLFQDIDDYVRYEDIVAQRLEQFDIHAHAFCWLPQEVHLAVQGNTAYLGRFMQAVGSGYARCSSPSTGSTKPVFRKQWQALQIKNQYLLPLIRCIHRLPCTDGATVPPADFQWSSDRAYRQVTPLPWLTTHVALQALTHLTDAAVASYEAFMQEEDVPTDPRHFASQLDHSPCISGDALLKITNQTSRQP